MKSYSELMADWAQLKDEIDLAREHEAQRLARRVLEVLAENGVDVAEMAARAAHPVPRRRRAAPKYWNPETGATWSGRGRRPAWLVGDDIERFRIELPETYTGPTSQVVEEGRK